MAFQFEGKKPGDIIKSSDWNTLNTEVVRLGTDKVDRAGDTIKGDLTVTGKVNVGGTLSVTGMSTLTGNSSVGGTLSVTGASTLTGNTSVSGTLSVTGIGAFNNNVTINGTLNLTANKELAFADNGQIRSGDNNHRILFRRSENKLELREFGQIVFSPGATAGAETAKMVLLDNGNVGVGTAAPKGFQVVLPEGSKAAPSPGITMAGGLDGNASIELRNNGSGTPYIDFAIQTGVDYDGRIRLTAPGQLAIEGANVGIGTTAPGAKLDVRGGLTILEQEAWKDAPLVNGWVNYQNSYNPGQYFKDSLGVVHLRGLIRAGANGTIAFTLPAGYRPAYRQLHVVSTNPNVAGRIDVDTSGNVIIVSGDPGWVGLDSISFRVA